VALKFGFIHFRSEANHSKNTKFKRPDQTPSLVLKTTNCILLGPLCKFDLHKTEKRNGRHVGVTSIRIGRAVQTFFHVIEASQIKQFVFLKCFSEKRNK